jgi:hypothetical protein
MGDIMLMRIESSDSGVWKRRFWRLEAQYKNGLPSSKIGAAAAHRYNREDLPELAFVFIRAARHAD